MISIDRLPSMTLGTMDTFEPSDRAKKQQRLSLGRMFGPTGIELCRGLRDGSIPRSALPDYEESVNNHFYGVYAERRNIPRALAPLDYKLIARDIKELDKKIIRDDFPILEGKLGNYVNVLKADPPAPASLFKVLALPKSEVDQLAVFQVVRFLIEGYAFMTEYPSIDDMVDVGSGQKVGKLNDLLNEHVFEGRYEAGGPYQFFAYHNDLTNRAIRLSPKNEEPKPARPGERLARHELRARKVKNYGSVHVDIIEPDPIEDARRSLAKAANGNGIIKPIQSGIKIIFVNLEDRPECCRGPLARRPLLRALEEIVIAGLAGGGRISSAAEVEENPPDVEPERIAKLNHNIVDLYIHKLSVLVRLEFLSRQDYLNQKYHVGIDTPVKGIPVDVPNGRAETLCSLVSDYKLVSHIFRRQAYLDVEPQAELLKTIFQEAARLKQECTY